MTIRWYARINGVDENGPFSAEQMLKLSADGSIGKETMVRTESSKWVEASTYPFLFEATTTKDKIASKNRPDGHISFHFASPKVSEMIQSLQSILQKHGDLPVVVTIKNVPVKERRSNYDGHYKTSFTLTEWRLKVSGDLFFNSVMAAIDVIPPEEIFVAK